MSTRRVVSEDLLKRTLRKPPQKSKKKGGQIEQDLFLNQHEEPVSPSDALVDTDFWDESIVSEIEDGLCSLESVIKEGETYYCLPFFTHVSVQCLTSKHR